MHPWLFSFLLFLLFLLSCWKSTSSVRQLSRCWNVIRVCNRNRRLLGKRSSARRVTQEHAASSFTGSSYTGSLATLPVHDLVHESFFLFHPNKVRERTIPCLPLFVTGEVNRLPVSFLLLLGDKLRRYFACCV